MKTFPLLAALLFSIAHAQAQTTTPIAGSTPAPAATPAPKDGGPGVAKGSHTRLKYTPPKSVVAGSPEGTVDGGSRGGGGNLPSLSVLAPSHIGLTTRAQPSLFWYQSAPAATRFELTLIESKNPKVVIRVGSEKAEHAGIHRILLAKNNVTLTPGVIYRWSVAFVPNTESRSQDVIASGRIECVQPDAQLAAALAGAQGMDRAALYAGKGFWYDALETVTDEINASPKNRELRLERASLLEQAGLKGAAAAERR